MDLAFRPLARADLPMLSQWRALEKVGFARTWAGTLDSDDASDEGPSYLYVRGRPAT